MPLIEQVFSIHRVVLIRKNLCLSQHLCVCLNGFKTLNDQVSLSMLVCQDLIFARDLMHSPIFHQASIERSLDQALGPHHDNFPRPLHLSTAIVQVQLERIKGLSIEIACPCREEFLPFCLNSVG